MPPSRGRGRRWGWCGRVVVASVVGALLVLAARIASNGRAGPRGLNDAAETSPGGAVQRAAAAPTLAAEAEEELRGATLTEAGDRGLRIAVVVVYSGQPANRVGGPRDTHLGYVRRHGYALVDAYNLKAVQDLEATLAGAQLFFLKYFAILQVLARYDAVLWIDQLMPFLNQSAGLEELLDPRFDIVAAAGAPSDPDMPQIFTTQALLVRNTVRAVELVQAVWALRKVDCRADDAKLRFQLTPTATACSVANGWWRDDVGAFNWLARSRRSIGCRVRLVPLRELASPVPSYGNGDRLLSTIRLSDAEREVFSEVFRDPSIDPNLEPPDPKYAGVVDHANGLVDVSRAPFLAPALLEHYPRGHAAWQLYEPWNVPC